MPKLALQTLIQQKNSALSKWNERDYLIGGAFVVDQIVLVSGELGNLRIGGELLNIVHPNGQEPTYQVMTVVGCIEFLSSQLYAYKILS